MRGNKGEMRRVRVGERRERRKGAAVQGGMRDREGQTVEDFNEI